MAKEPSPTRRVTSDPALNRRAFLRTLGAGAANTVVPRALRERK